MKWLSKALLIVFTAGLLHAQAAPAENPSATPVSPIAPAATLTPTPELKLSGRFGIGSGFIDNKYGSSTCLSLRYWLLDGVCVDFLGYYSGYTNPGNSFAGASVADPYYQVGGGLGFKFNLAEIRKNLFLQLDTQGSYYLNHYQFSYVNEQDITDNETWSLFAGIGFEYFFPFLDCLSVESSLGFMQGFDFSKAVYNYNPAQVSNTNFIATSSGTDGRLLVNGGSLGGVSLHLYF